MSLAPDAATSAARLDELRALGGAGVEVVELPGAPAEGCGVVRIGVDRRGDLPAVDFEAFDILLSVRADAPRPWVAARDIDAGLAQVVAAATAQPAAAAVAAQVLRTSLRLGFEEALVAESLAYSMLLAAEGFRAWRAAHPPRARPESAEGRVRRADGEIRLSRPDRRNAFDSRMRDELCEALELALYAEGPVVLSGEGPAFSAGGDLDEFGQAEDVGRAHLIRTLRSPARLAHALGERLTVRVHGACVGAGIEIPAAAGRIVAQAGAACRLPEVAIGLIPGAGGTATIPRRVGRHRACWMAISGAQVETETALAWGLFDAVTR